MAKVRRKKEEALEEAIAATRAMTDARLVSGGTSADPQCRAKAAVLRARHPDAVVFAAEALTEVSRTSA